MTAAPDDASGVGLSVVVAPDVTTPKVGACVVVLVVMLTSRTFSSPENVKWCFSAPHVDSRWLKVGARR